MKHQPILSEPEAAPRGDLQLRPVLGRNPEGLPVLAGASGEILVLSELPEPGFGLVAVCKDMPERVVVLGYVSAGQVAQVGLAQAGFAQGGLAQTGLAQPALAQTALAQPGLTQGVADADGWVSIGCGKAQIRLHPDGRMRLKAQDITIDSAGRLGLRGAWIDLN